MRTTKAQPKPIKDQIVTLKLESTLVQSIDSDATAEGLTRSAIIRRILLQRYRTSRKVA